MDLSEYKSGVPPPGASIFQSPVAQLAFQAGSFLARQYAEGAVNYAGRNLRRRWDDAFSSSSSSDRNTRPRVAYSQQSSSPSVSSNSNASRMPFSRARPSSRRRRYTRRSRGGRRRSNRRVPIRRRGRRTRKSRKSYRRGKRRTPRRMSSLAKKSLHRLPYIPCERAHINYLIPVFTPRLDAGVTGASSYGSAGGHGTVGRRSIALIRDLSTICDIIENLIQNPTGSPMTAASVFTVEKESTQVELRSNCVTPCKVIVRYCKSRCDKPYLVTSVPFTLGALAGAYYTLPASFPETDILTGLTTFTQDQNITNAVALVPDLSLYGVPNFVTNWDVTKTSTFTLWPGKAKRLKFNVGRRDYSIRKYYNSPSVTTANRVYNVCKGDTFIMVEVLGVPSYVPPAPGGSANVTCQYTDAIVTCQIKKHYCYNINVNNAKNNYNHNANATPWPSHAQDSLSYGAIGSNANIAMPGIVPVEVASNSATNLEPFL